MKRRDYFAATAVTLSLPISGCIENSSADNERREPYETCENRAAIGYNEFPDDLQSEIDAAIDGGYTPDSETIHLDEAVDFESTYVLHDGYYVGRIEDETLYLEEDTEPRGLGTSRAISVIVQTDASVKLVYDGNEVVETFEDDEVFKDVIWGRYELFVEREAGEDESRSFGVDWGSFSAKITVTDEGVEISQAVLSPAVCPWGL